MRKGESWKVLSLINNLIKSIHTLFNNRKRISHWIYNTKVSQRGKYEIGLHISHYQYFSFFRTGISLFVYLRELFTAILTDHNQYLASRDWDLSHTATKCVINTLPKAIFGWSFTVFNQQQKGILTHSGLPSQMIYFGPCRHLQIYLSFSHPVLLLATF